MSSDTEVCIGQFMTMTINPINNHHFKMFLAYARLVVTDHHAEQ